MKNRDVNLEKLITEVNTIREKSQPDCYSYKEGMPAKVKKALEELSRNHNHSWAVEIFLRNQDNLDAIAMNYRGHKITYGEMFSHAYDYAKSLKELGVREGDQIPICSSNIPEFVYLFLAVNFVGGVANVIGEWFDKDYLKSILDQTKSKIIFVSDDIYSDILPVIEKSDVNQIYVMSLTDSLLTDSEGKKFDPYEQFDSLVYKMENKVGQIREESSKDVLDMTQFEEIGKNYTDPVLASTDLNSLCTITYTSGTTNPGKPTGCMHANRSYITLSRFKESDVSGMPSMRGLTVLAHIPTYTHMDLTCSISDTFFEKCTLALEPFYSVEFFPYSLLINKPNFVPASVAAWVHLGKLLEYDSRFKGVKMPFLMLPTITGEAASPGEEKFLNYVSRKHKFGTEKLPFPLAPVTFSIGGGTGENSGVFVTLFKALQEKLLSNLIKKDTLGLTPYKMVDLEVLDENGDYCEIGQPGILVLNSPCDMIGYVDPSLNNNTHIVDRYGKEWYNSNTFAMKSDKQDRIKMLGRPRDVILLSDSSKLPYFALENEVLKDTKNIMSCSLVHIPDSDQYVCHMEMQPTSSQSDEKILKSCAERLQNKIPDEVLDQLFFRVRSFEESFPAAPSGKRDTKKLIAEGITDQCIPCRELLPKEKESERVYVKK